MDEAISQMPQASALDGSELFPVVQGGINKRAFVSQIPFQQPAGQLLVSATDGFSGYLHDKIAAGANITLSILMPGGNELLKIDAAGGGGGLAIGQPVAGSIPGAVLYVDAAGTLRQLAGVLWDAANGTLDIIAPSNQPALSVVGQSPGGFAAGFQGGCFSLAICDTAGSVQYSAGAPGNWSGGPPGDVWTALDRIAAVLAGMGFPP